MNDVADYIRELEEYSEIQAETIKELEQRSLEDMVTMNDIYRAAKAIQGRGDINDAEDLVLQVISALQSPSTEG